MSELIQVRKSELSSCKAASPAATAVPSAAQIKGSATSAVSGRYALGRSGRAWAHPAPLSGRGPGGRAEPVR